MNALTTQLPPLLVGYLLGLMYAKTNRTNL